MQPRDAQRTRRETEVSETEKSSEPRGLSQDGLSPGFSTALKRATDTCWALVPHPVAELPGQRSHHCKLETGKRGWGWRESEGVGVG